MQYLEYSDYPEWVNDLLLEEEVYDDLLGFVVRSFRVTPAFKLVAWIEIKVLTQYKHPKNIWASSLVDQDLVWSPTLINVKDHDFLRWDVMTEPIPEGIAWWSSGHFGRKLCFPDKHLKHVLKRLLSMPEDRGAQ